MEAKYNWLNSLLNVNKSEFSQWPEIKWANPYDSYNSQKQRDELLNKIGNTFLYKNTKPYLKGISKGCEICGSGKWSCLFITNKCNAKCFYCPTPQNNDEVPSTQELDFDDPADYAEYIRHFQFEGVSFSGGEPLLYFNRTLDYLQTLRKKCSNDLYIWAYTNGLLADKERLKALARANLNEIRFDVGATGFSLDKVKIAKGIVPNITIEIPSIPEEKDRIIELLPQMVKAGVSHLNLHQLRLTRHNANHLVKRGYTIVPAERPLVLESEMSALEIISAAKERGLDIGINYCSFHYKNRFQKAGFRKIIAEKIFPGALLTNNGYIREYDENSIVYLCIKIVSDITGLTEMSTISIEGKEYGYSVLKIFNESNLSDSLRKRINELLEHEPAVPPTDPLLFKIWQFEYIEDGLWSV